MKKAPEERAPGWRARFGVPGWLILSFWIFFGIILGNQIILNMPDHGHSWVKMVGWQAGSALGWAALTPLILWFAIRVPLVPKLWPVLAHLAGSVASSALQVLPTTVLAMFIHPYTPVTHAQPFLSEYLFQFSRWRLLNVLIYFGIVALGTGVQAKRRQVREAELRAELSQAQLRALRLELQPHFLFNSLNAVVGLVRSGSAQEAERMLIQISELLRRTLDATSRQMVSVSEEMQLAELYLQIQEVRFGDRLATRFEVDAAAAELPVPHLLLQPIVENAVRHGVGKREQGGTISLSAHVEARELVLRVCDDGPGLSSAWDEEEHSGYGLENVSSRLEAVYGSRWSLEMYDRSQGGARVEIRVPVQPEVEPELLASSPAAATTSPHSDPIHASGLAGAS